MAGSLDDSIYNNGRSGGGGGGFKFSKGFNKDSISKRIIMMLFFSKGIRAWSCIILLYFLQSSISIISASFYMCLFSAIFSVVVEKPWNLLSSLRPSQIKKIIYHSIFNLLIIITWNSSIKFIGPIGSILASDYTFSTYPLIFNSLLQGNFLATDMSRGSIMLMIGYFLIPLFGISNRLDILGYTSSQVFMIGLFSLIVHNVLVLWKKTIVRSWNSGSSGGKNKLSSLGSCVSTIILFVFKLFEGFSSGSSGSDSINQVSYSQLFVIAIITFILYSLNQFIDDVSEKELTFNVLSKVSLTSSVIFGLLAALFIGFKDFFHPILILSFIFIINAIHILYSKSNDIQPMTFSNNMDGGNSSIKTYNSSGGGGGGSIINGNGSGNAIYYFEILKDVLRQIVDKPTSRRIFTFLVINLMFMFVEMAYGIWTNSLGLITDACHMFFDATALFIALVAEVISQWKQNDKYSYGYGRFQVLSGFVNGIFLIFIAVTILMESVERLLEPPEINTDKLLLVSVLGFIINLIGIFSFHGDHGHSHGGGGGHSHGGGEKKEKHHGHSHGGHGDHQQVTPILGEEKKKKRSVNIDGVFLHLLADTLGSVGVIVSSLIIQIWGYTLADPICSLLISILIFLSVLPLIANTAKTLLQCTPEPIQSSLYQINQFILSIDGVHNIISYHFWSHYDDMNIATLKIQLNETASSNSTLDTERIKKSISKYLNKDHNIHKCIIEFIPLLYNNNNQQQGNDVPLINHHIHNDIHHNHSSSSSSSSHHHRHN
ncbi:hypothetical protein DDB_G0291141 [Dictyostelium discoideum AX4]|uniref:Probable zinc transporter protein DDB_G0291141 n=1 Tax=Dictyostelium discoideum TaxID=44689 RepID=Y1141_DICDI|nr:hypothetical protein DDB_G0291141 [Dictyostelium discoideum AX4]Q54F34.1 RecName: Full=Probable zinc transporter protein DDB_G0291141 [Dictyostelium discoideum]EAL61854.1 hypothetical protein DDB_G0291141 [Dictyostelium discoideum AX4]|eukprot:XP_635356.1 hypothetical protein DDB_G0291141 [Dictyostelium discoideum AX4]